MKDMKSSAGESQQELLRHKQETNQQVQSLQAKLEKKKFKQAETKKLVAATEMQMTKL